MTQKQVVYKKEYTSPVLVEYGGLIEITQDGGGIEQDSKLNPGISGT